MIFLAVAVTVAIMVVFLALTVNEALAVFLDVAVTEAPAVFAADSVTVAIAVFLDGCDCIFSCCCT